ncbi:hypothetical protein HCU01_29430 [Halomonas cupida]|uniref:Photosynthesis system II assembly factor Ycf48/Hcf136-like domain-containing protein n=1 Tax=Halomonas cupida TaxID=44933 RepID=A0A1M7K6V0_9GAMM|nr:hypothetical protein [Halomonas cupida]GEN24994.1 hypothetical protein HCU01_29430 [Halomonas cupida]SHM60911.1 hypothetical protein SAMN05660971_03371 [Halomonas cupida]
MLPRWIRPCLYAALLCYGVFVFAWYLMVGYARPWHEEPEQALTVALQAPVEWDTLQTTAANGDSLWSVASRGRDGEVEACSEAGECRATCLTQGEVATGEDLPTLNCLVASQAEEVYRTSLGFDFEPLNLTYLMRADGKRVDVVGRLGGEVSGMHCDTRGHCYLFAELTGVPDQTVFASDDNGVHWRLAAQSVLDGIGMIQLLHVDKQRIWLADSGSLYLSENGGQDWRELADAHQLLTGSSQLGSATLRDDSLARFRWGMDETGRVYAMVENRGSDTDSVLLLQLNAQTGELIDIEQRPGQLQELVNGAGDQLYAIHRAAELERYTLYRLSAGEWLPLKASGRSPQSSLRGNDNLLLINAGRGDGRHMELSRDGGKSWVAMETIPYGERRVFDPTGAGILEFRYLNDAGYYRYRWIRP